MRARTTRIPVQQVAVLGMLIVIGGVFAKQSDAFLQWNNLANILLQSSAVAIVSVGMTFVILMRGIDLSVGSIMNLALAAAVFLAGTHDSLRVETNTTVLVYPVALVSGLLLGLLNAFAILQLRVNPLIATLGTMTLYRGIGLHLTGATEVLLGGNILDFGRAMATSLVAWPVIVVAVALGLVIILGSGLGEWLGRRRIRHAEGRIRTSDAVPRILSAPVPPGSGVTPRN